MDNNQIFLQTKFINLELSNTSLNDLLNIIKKYKIKYQLVEYVEYEYIENIQKDILRSKMILGNSSPRLNYYYSLFKHSRYKKKIITLIKQNLLED